MADSTAFSHACLALENETTFSRIEARGTIRLALKGAGLDPKSINVDQLRVVLERVLPTELANRGITDFEAVCRRIALSLTAVAANEAAETPEDVFSRLGGR